MNWQFTPYAFAYLVTVAISLGVAFVCWNRRAIPGGVSLTLLMFAVAEWAATGALEIAAVGIPAKMIWSKVGYPGTLSSPVLLLIFALEFSQQKRWLTRRRLALLWIIPAITLGLAFIDEWHGLIWSSFTLSPTGENILIYGHGAWFWFEIAYSYLMVIAGIYILLRTFVRLQGTYRQQAGMLFVASLLPFAGNIIYVFGFSPVPGLDLTPIAFAMTGWILAWGILEFHLLDLVPVARDALIEIMSDGVLVLDSQNRVVDINPAARRLIDLDSTPVIGQQIDAICAPLSEAFTLHETSPTVPAEIRVDSDSSRSLEVQISDLNDRRERATGHLIVLRDMTKRRESEQTVRQLSRAVEQSPVTVVITDTRGNIEYVNPKFSQLTGYRFEEAIGKNPRMLQSGQTPPEEYERLWKTITIGGVWRGEFINRKKNGELYWESAVISPITNAEGAITHFVAVKEDITERKQTEESLHDANARLQAQLREIEGLHAQLREQAIRDSLTGLFNRRYLVETFERELARAARENCQVGVVLMDVDHFKTVNDTFGHQAGDMMLQALGELLRTTTRQMDIACRHGGEEFIVVLTGSTLAATRRRAEIWRQAVETLRVSYDGHLLNATISVGVAMFPEHGATGDDLTHAADRALYAAKAAGRNCVRVFGENE